jgi:hypothetical protein
LQLAGREASGLSNGVLAGAGVFEFQTWPLISCWHVATEGFFFEASSFKISIGRIFDLPGVQGFGGVLAFVVQERRTRA